jgi:hypothetical protein
MKMLVFKVKIFKISQLSSIVLNKVKIICRRQIHQIKIREVDLVLKMIY